MLLGGGRETKESEIDLNVGILLHSKVGDYVKKGDVVATFFANDEKKLNNAVKRFENAYIIDDKDIQKERLIRYIVTDEGVNKVE